MNFVADEVNNRFSNHEYPCGKKDTRTVPLGSEPIMPNPDGSSPLCLHDGVRIDKVGFSYLCNIRWGAVARGEVPQGVTTLDQLAENPEGKVEFYLSVTNHADRNRLDPAPSIHFDKDGKVTYVSRYAPGERDSIETSVRGILNLL